MEAVTMEIMKSVSAGSLESSDVLVTLGPAQNGGLDIIVNSIVEKQFGRRIKMYAEELLENSGIDSGLVNIQDRGALECTLRARIETAISRVFE
jgi:citrate lyase subunit gamma (acyl carrier protein)